MKTPEWPPDQILLVEDSPSDAELTVEALKEAKVRNHLSIVEDGVQALEFLHRQGKYTKAPRPDLIMLDLNLPRKDGREVLAEIKADENSRRFPVVVLDHFPGRAGRAARLPTPRQLLHHQAGGFRPVSESGAVHRNVLAVCRDPAAALPSGSSGVWAPKQVTGGKWDVLRLLRANT